MPVCSGKQSFVHGMEASNATSSFLCFLPELECTPTSMMYCNGITETDRVHHFSTKPSSPLAKKNGLNGNVDSPSRLLNASAEVCSSTGNPLVGRSCQKEVLRIGAPSCNTGEQPDLVTTTAFQSSNQGELGSLEAAECHGPHNLSQYMVEEEDVLAFEITEFFDAFKDGNEQSFTKIREKWDLVSPDPRGNHLGSISNSKTTDGQANSGKQGILRIEDSTDSGMCSRFSSAGRSGKWNGVEADSFSTTFSGPLTFSGPISLSGHSVHTPYSGSVSHRSDSSTASTHSFAFPILPCEWNSSPVKMPQPDKRFTGKGWKQRLHSFFCCGNSLD